MSPSEPSSLQNEFSLSRCIFALYRIRFARDPSRRRSLWYFYSTVSIVRVVSDPTLLASPSLLPPDPTSPRPPPASFFRPSRMNVIKRSGESVPVKFDKITTRISRLCFGLNRDYIDPSVVAQKVGEVGCRHGWMSECAAL